MGTVVSAKEIENAQKVSGFLSNIDSISFKPLREDIFQVTCDELVAIVDAEESIVCIELVVCDANCGPAEVDAEINVLLLEENAKSIHGKFAISGGKIVIKENLETENLDANEFEAALAWVFGMASSTIESIYDITNKEVA